ncbi:putative calcium-transporting ATPase 13, plasma membrane-type [Eucalyptus grandis]|uniref:putative calcium-transporting ATPase 13, plasma membrane-type n=1 Tax=Eucalyptus grandis TaxID=71139 RepID=UPI00192EC84A|nr:putative calcium-transporting ATPase 13, plasma membrane-type [Eucalyptus grandis]
MTSILRGGSSIPHYEVSLPLLTMYKFAQRWRLAFAAIYCSRALLAASIDQSQLGTLTPSCTSISIPDEALTFQIDQSQLTRLVNDKNLNCLREFGGINRVASALETDVSDGISGEQDDITRRQNTFGVNKFKRPTEGFFHFLLQAFKDLTHLTLLVCAGLSPGLAIKEKGVKEGSYSGGSPIFAVFFVIMVSAVSKYHQNRQFHKLRGASANILIHVIRKGRQQQVSRSKIVVGDVICLKIGDQVPADGLFIGGHSLQVDESIMTGESDPIEVNSIENPFLFSRTKVAHGDARMLVTSVGMNTMWGEMMSSINRCSSEQTPLQAQLNKLTSSISKVGLAVNFLVLVDLLIRYFTGTKQDEKRKPGVVQGQKMDDNIIKSVGNIIETTVTVVGVAIPEGLPLAVTLTLAYSMKRMMADQVMVRKLWAFEKMALATTICTDKTGTLTNQMEVTKFCVGQDSVAENTYYSASKYVLDLIQDGVALNTAGSVYKPTSGPKYNFSGSPIEKAILSWAVSQLSMDTEETKKRCKVIQVEAFNSQNKRSGVLIKKSGDDKFHVHWKGAAEMVLAMCSCFYDGSGIERDLDEDKRARCEQIIQGMAESSLTCIAFAHKQVPEEAAKEREDGKKIQEDGLTLLGLVGINNLCRPDVKSAVQACQEAGVNIKMITGDNIITAKAIAVECGILKPGDDNETIMEGDKFRSYTPEERLLRVEKIRVIARSLPSDKLLMVECLKQKGHVVAITGDGTNDALALKKADIGISMGIQETEFTEESSDIIILNGNFASVAKLLQWSRCVYDNIQKFIQFQLTVNVAGLLFNFVAVVSSGDVPLTAIQLIWVNLIMDILGAFALSTERPTKELMEKPPVGLTEPLITNVMWGNLVGQAIYQVAILLTLQFKGKSIFGVDKAMKRTLMFNTFVLCQVFNEFNARKLKKKNVFGGIHKNKLFLGIIFVTMVLQVVMVEFLKRFAGTERLSWGQWGTCLGIAAVSWPIGWVVKCIPIPDTPIFSYLGSKSKKLVRKIVHRQYFIGFRNHNRI